MKYLLLLIYNDRYCFFSVVTPCLMFCFSCFLRLCQLRLIFLLGSSTTLIEINKFVEIFCWDLPLPLLKKNSLSSVSFHSFCFCFCWINSRCFVTVRSWISLILLLLRRLLNTFFFCYWFIWNICCNFCFFVIYATKANESILLLYELCFFRVCRIRPFLLQAVFIQMNLRLSGMFLQTEFRSTKGDVPLSSDVLLLLYLNISTWYYLCVFGVQTSKCPLEFNKEIRSLDVFFLFFCFCVDYWISVHVMDWFSCFLILSLLKTNSWVVWLYTNTILSKISMSNNCTFVFSVTPLAFNETIYSVGNFCWKRIFFLQSLFYCLF